MSAILKKIIDIIVTDGDAINDNKILKDNGTVGKSNTGTYFLCSYADRDIFMDCFEKCKHYYFYPKGVLEYKLIFKEKYSHLRSKYKNNMDSFETDCDYFLSFSHMYTRITFRINEPRIFFRFEDNTDAVVKAFRKLLYSENTKIVLEFEEDICRIYPKFVDKEILLD